jgi:hypothetical protein
MAACMAACLPACLHACMPASFAPHRPILNTPPRVLTIPNAPTRPYTPTKHPPKHPTQHKQQAFLSDASSAGNWVPTRFVAGYMTHAPAIEPEAFDACPILLTQPAQDRWTPLALR